MWKFMISFSLSSHCNKLVYINWSNERLIDSNEYGYSWNNCKSTMIDGWLYGEKSTFFPCNASITSKRFSECFNYIDQMSDSRREILHIRTMQICRCNRFFVLYDVCMQIQWNSVDKIIIRLSIIYLIHDEILKQGI